MNFQYLKAYFLSESQLVSAGHLKVRIYKWKFKARILDKHNLNVTVWFWQWPSNNGLKDVSYFAHPFLSCMQINSHPQFESYKGMKIWHPIWQLSSDWKGDSYSDAPCTTPSMLLLKVVPKRRLFPAWRIFWTNSSFSQDRNTIQS